MSRHMIGIYEKALSNHPNLIKVLHIFKQTKFDYLEIAIDDSEERLSRLEIDKKERKRINEYMEVNNLHIHSIVLSANRVYPLGSPNANIRKQGQEIVYKAIELASDLRIPIIQLAGYYTFSESRDGGERERFIESLEQIVDVAASRGVMLGIENMDGEDILSIKDAKSILEHIQSPWLQLYPDIGNLVANGLSLDEELQDMANCTIAIHLKDTRRNVFRRVPFGQGDVDFALAAQKLHAQGYRGCYTIEMWNDGNQDSIQLTEIAYQYLKNKMNL